jgi:hypothetical protein
MTNKKIRINIRLLKDVYELLTESSKIDFEDRVTSRLRRAIEKGLKEKQHE